MFAKRLRNEASCLIKMKAKKGSKMEPSETTLKMKAQMREFWANAVGQMSLITGLAEQTRKL